MFIVSIKRDDGNEVQLKPGGHAERDLIAQVKIELESHGVGWFKSEAKVLDAVEKALNSVLYSIKSDILPQ